jgi:uncharacterized damage-inducible protein DinB
MRELEIAEYLGRQLTERILPVFAHGIERIPQSALGFRPTPDNMTAKELAYHVPQVVFLLARSVKTGRFEAQDLDLLDIDPEDVQTPGALSRYAEEARGHVAEVVERLSESDLTRTIAAGPRDTALEMLMLAVEEAIHHRGQLSTYLRLMGVMPPNLYEAD